MIVIRPEAISSSEKKPSCHICGNSQLTIFPRYSQFHRVTSDCKPWQAGGTLAVCCSCGCVQKLTNDAWQAETDAIYHAYSIYSQSEGAEQVVFDQVSGSSTSRSLKLLNYISEIIAFPKAGNHLDIGCGNGALLYQFHERFPDWTLFGIELNAKYQDRVEAIARVKKMYVSSQLDIVQGTFECITMVHVLEHILHPEQYLEKINNLLKKDGILIIDVPVFGKNPYDLLVADHCTHFSEETLCSLLRKAGFDVIHSTTNCIPKELTVVARKIDEKKQDTHPPENKQTLTAINKCLDWLESNIRDSVCSAGNGHIGIFGTSIAATWLFSEIPDIVDFFVDEDPDRIGRMHLGRPVYDLGHSPQNSVIFLPFFPQQAQQIKSRLEKQADKRTFTFSTIS